MLFLLSKVSGTRDAAALAADQRRHQPANSLHTLCARRCSSSYLFIMFAVVCLV